MAKDPVCTMEVDANRVQDKSEYYGEYYYFCSPSCKKAFDDNPGAYALDIDYMYQSMDGVAPCD